MSGPPVFSKRLLAASLTVEAGEVPGDPYTSPAGVTTIVRDIELLLKPGGDGTGSCFWRVFTTGAAIEGPFVNEVDPVLFQQWQGRMVLEGGDSIQVVGVSLAPAEVDYWISGYVLKAGP